MDRQFCILAPFLLLNNFAALAKFTSLSLNFFCLSVEHYDSFIVQVIMRITDEVHQVPGTYAPLVIDSYFY